LRVIHFCTQRGKKRREVRERSGLPDQVVDSYSEFFRNLVREIPQTTRNIHHVVGNRDSEKASRDCSTRSKANPSFVLAGQTIQVFIGPFAGEVTDHIARWISSRRLSTEAATYRDEMLDWRCGDASRAVQDIDKVDRDPLCSFVSARLNSIAWRKFVTLSLRIRRVGKIGARHLVLDGFGQSRLAKMAHNPGLGGSFKSFGSRHRVGGIIIQFHLLKMMMNHQQPQVGRPLIANFFIARPAGLG